MSSTSSIRGGKIDNRSGWSAKESISLQPELDLEKWSDLVSDNAKGWHLQQRWWYEQNHKGEAV